jgi:hypothetical protein
MARRPRKRWSELSRAQRTAIVVAGAVQVTLAAVAVNDLVRRPAAQVRGPKWAWAPAMAVNFVGPVAYLCAGRRPAPDAGPVAA